MKKLLSIALRIRMAYLWLLLPVAFGFKQWTNAVLNDWYTRSRFPVSYFEGQLSFSSAKLTTYYRYMLDADSLHVYYQTQLLDFVFIAATFLLHGCIGLLFYRLFSHRPSLRKFSLIALAAGLSPPCFDILENLVSFIFIADPEQIRQPLALLYSSFSACKFGLFFASYAMFAALLGCAAWLGISRLKPASRANKHG